MIKPNIREEAANKLLACDLILERIIDGKPVSVESAKSAKKGIKAIMDWLDKRQYKTDK